VGTLNPWVEGVGWPPPQKRVSENPIGFLGGLDVLPEWQRRPGGIRVPVRAQKEAPHGPSRRKGANWSGKRRRPQAAGEGGRPLRPDETAGLMESNKIKICCGKIEKI